MASLLSHPAIPVGLFLSKVAPPSKKLFYLSLALTLLPDADSIGFKLGVPYASQWGHRGFTHSLVFALLVAFCCLLFSKQLETPRGKIFCWTFLATISHPLLDALTNGGLGVALLWPFSHERFFAPIRPVSVSPIGILSFLSFRGVMVVLSEILWIWSPILILSFLIRRLKCSKFPS